MNEYKGLNSETDNYFNVTKYCPVGNNITNSVKSFIYKNMVKIVPYKIPNTTTIQYRVYPKDKEILLYSGGLGEAFNFADYFINCEINEY